MTLNTTYSPVRLRLFTLLEARLSPNNRACLFLNDKFEKISIRVRQRRPKYYLIKRGPGKQTKGLYAKIRNANWKTGKKDHI